MSTVEDRVEAIRGFEYRQYLDGKKLYAWLERDYPDLMANKEGIFGEAGARRVYEWKVTEHPVSYASADRVLVRVDLLIDVDVPADCWLPIIQHYNASRHSHKRERGEELLEEGFSRSEIGRRLGVSSKVVEGWEHEKEFRDRADRNWKRAGYKRAGLEPDPNRPGRVRATA